MHPDQCTCFHTKQLSRFIARLYDKELANAGMKSTQYALLRHVATHGPIAAGELARLLGLDASTLTRNLQLVIEAGWISVTAGNDSRVRVVALTQTGGQAYANARVHWIKAQEKLAEALGPELTEQLDRVVAACNGKLRELHGQFSS